MEYLKILDKTLPHSLLRKYLIAICTDEDLIHKFRVEIAEHLLTHPYSDNKYMNEIDRIVNSVCSDGKIILPVLNNLTKFAETNNLFIGV